MEALLTQLKLARVREVLAEWLTRAAEEEMSYADFLKGLLTEEVCARKENQLKRHRHQANFPFEKTIEQFDFSLRPGLKRQVFLNLLDISFVHQARSLILLGPSGTGKTHPSNYPSGWHGFPQRVCHRHRPKASAVWTHLASGAYHPQTVSGTVLHCPPSGRYRADCALEGYQSLS